MRQPYNIVETTIIEIFEKKGWMFDYNRLFHGIYASFHLLPFVSMPLFSYGKNILITNS
jgi:hypothetical protein